MKPSPTRVARRFLAALNLARNYRIGSELFPLEGAELIPDFKWADQWGDSVGTIADRFLELPG